MLSPIILREAIASHRFLKRSANIVSLRELQDFPVNSSSYSHQYVCRSYHKNAFGKHLFCFVKYGGWCTIDLLSGWKNVLLVEYSARSSLHFN